MDNAAMKGLLFKAEEFEKYARDLRDQSSENMAPTVLDEIHLLFETSWQGYHDVEKQVREALLVSDSADNNELLAQVLMDIHIHPNSGYERDSKALWEAQYLWLHLYFRSRNEYYFEQAQFCDGVRHAKVELISE